MTCRIRLAAMALGLILTVAPLAVRADDCVAIAEPVWFCYPAGSWEAFDDGSPETVASFVSLMQVFAQFFINQGGANAGETLDSAVASVRDQLAQGAPGTEVTVAETSAAEVDGVPGRTIVVSVSDGARSAMITATIIVTPDHTLRLATVAVSDTYTENIRQMHRIFLNEIRLSNPNE